MDSELKVIGSNLNVIDNLVLLRHLQVLFCFYSFVEKNKNEQKRSGFKRRKTANVNDKCFLIK